MYVVTADQVGSRTGPDLVPAVLAGFAPLRTRLATQPDRTAGDEIQLVTASAATALEIVLRLTRTGQWSVGLGVGKVVEPLPAMAREGSGPAFVHARAAIEEAKRRPFRFALTAERAADGEHVESLLDLLLSLRERRTPEGWEVCDLIEDGLRQAEIAERLGITPQAVSLRLKAAGRRLEERALPALVVLLDALEPHQDVEGTHP